VDHKNLFVDRRHKIISMKERDILSVTYLFEDWGYPLECYPELQLPHNFLHHKHNTSRALFWRYPFVWQLFLVRIRFLVATILAFSVARRCVVLENCGFLFEDWSTPHLIESS
jgi:hypothetical protein